MNRTITQRLMSGEGVVDEETGEVIKNRQTDFLQDYVCWLGDAGLLGSEIGKDQKERESIMDYMITLVEQQILPRYKDDPSRFNQIARKAYRFVTGSPLQVPTTRSGAKAMEFILERYFHQRYRPTERPHVAALAEARIFNIPTRIFEALNDAAELYVPEKHYEQALAQLQFPDKLPFQSCYLGFPAKIGMNTIVTHDQTNEDLREHKQYDLWGFVVAPGMAVAMLGLSPATCTDMQVYLNGVWMHGYVGRKNTLPWIVVWLVEWLLSHQSTAVESNTHQYRRVFRSIQQEPVKKLAPLPYYTIRMTEKVQEVKQWCRLRYPRFRATLQHQFDVRGAYVVRVKRGPLPLDPKVERELRKDPRRKVFTDQPLDAETQACIEHKGIKPKGKREWMAVLIFWRKPHRKGPEGAPYIPGIRQSPRSV